MSEEPYLWDKSDPSDDFVVKLEDVLTAKRTKTQKAGQRPRRRVLRVVGSLAAVAAVAITAWMCSGGDRNNDTRETHDVVPPVAIDTDVSTELEAENVLEEHDHDKKVEVQDKSTREAAGDSEAAVGR